MGCLCKRLARRRNAPMPVANMTLLDPETMPPGGYQYYEKATNTRITSPTLRQLAETVIRHRQANSVTTGDLDIVMVECQNQICSTAPPGVCRDVQGQLVAAGVNLSVNDVISGTRTLWDWWWGGKQKVDKQKATERAKICASCFANRDPVGCSSCTSSALREFVDKIVGTDATDYDSFLKACAICGCQTRAKVWLPLDLLRKHTSAEKMSRFPEHCWLVNE